MTRTCCAWPNALHLTRAETAQLREGVYLEVESDDGDRFHLPIAHRDDLLDLVHLDFGRTPDGLYRWVEVWRCGCVQSMSRTADGAGPGGPVVRLVAHGVQGVLM